MSVRKNTVALALRVARLLAWWLCVPLLAAPAPPANDTAAGAQVIPSAGPFPYLTPAVDAAGATTVGDPRSVVCQRSVARSLWYSFTPAETSTSTISTCAETGTTVSDTVMGIYVPG
ncbi:MAG: hypothetical protein HYY24_14715 [Verrucomicrobia bacterium]|nr:hypothetical protein [Verrucomicrobiota bacterium]